MNMFRNCCDYVLMQQLCMHRTMSVAFDAACYIKNVAKCHLKKPADLQPESPRGGSGAEDPSGLCVIFAFLLRLFGMLYCYQVLWRSLPCLLCSRLPSLISMFWSAADNRLAGGE